MGIDPLQRTATNVEIEYLKRSRMMLIHNKSKKPYDFARCCRTSINITQQKGTYSRQTVIRVWRFFLTLEWEYHAD